MRKRNMTITLMFTVFIFAAAVLTAVLPKSDVSVNEKRTLASFPSFSVEKLFSGKWESDFESYISDHFPFRDFFAGTDSYFMLFTGRNGSNGIYSGKDDFLLTTPVAADYKKLDDNIDAVNMFAQTAGIETKMIVVPSSGGVNDALLPMLHRSYNDGEIISYIGDRLEGVGLIDATEALSQNGAENYYKTDHHWTSEGAHSAYRLWCGDEGIEPRAREDYTITAQDGFYGTSYSKSALWLSKPDVIEMWEYPIDVTVTIDDDDQYDTMFFKEHLSENDKYPVYLDGNHALVRITNNGGADGKKVLLIKDSYAHCFAPFMAENCSRIDMVDLRYYFDPLSDMTSAEDYDEILILYGISNLCEANDLSILR